MNFISFSLNGASKSRILETQIKDIIYVLKSSKSKGFINPDKKKVIWKTQIKDFYLGFKQTYLKVSKTQIKIFYLENPDKKFLSDPDKKISSGFIYS